ncbi:estradiol 17-beta-dehydrogenase [Cucurbitaria berberidis CBS 394.84]|uniref:Estradiol 17-beta-dehydrogenase n=1 Tax=Cucurbitaria berberidis CBS 394.84 TaxID=1168544 RepID=A0A9P4GM54_9PLEO|nr:estradiol 17-beta-dehydrogenase [Cucurbitaria berberidis CBS 394.84]KAF1847601.1 estradiol 17-beta-dehydrogenase [Cucurbitaria berberidis CBS 394.84]
MHYELAPLGICVTVIEPGYFRTWFLSAGAQVKSQKKIQEYDETSVGQIRDLLDKTDNNQPGDVVKGCKVLIDILKKTAIVEGKEVPIRVALGSDSPVFIRRKCEETITLLDEWDDIPNETDHE